MDSLKGYIIEKLKVSPSKYVSFDDLIEALFNFCEAHTVFEMENLERFKYEKKSKLPFFRHPMILTGGKEIDDHYGYIHRLCAEKGKHNTEPVIIVFYTRFPNDKALSVCRISKDRYNSLTDYIEPEIMEEIYNYLKLHA